MSNVLIDQMVERVVSELFSTAENPRFTQRKWSE
jgi:hypothetical protein